MSDAGEPLSGVGSSAPIVAEGEIPKEAYGFAPMTRDSALPVVGLLVMSGIAIVVDLPTYAFGFFVGALLLVAPRALWAIRMARARIGKVVHRFEVSDDGLGLTWTMQDGRREEKHYEWFMFEQHLVEAHRLLLYLRAPSVPGRTRTEVVLLPRALFGDEWDAVCAIVAAHVKKLSVAPAPKPPPMQRWRALLLWGVLIVALMAIYFVVAGR